MVAPLITVAEFQAAVAADDEDRFRWSDLARFEYDAPKERCALVSWREDLAAWGIVECGDARRWSELHDIGVLLFGEPPWRRSQVLRVVGRLGSVEAAVAALARPDAAFAYAFAFEAMAKPVARRGAGAAVLSPAQQRGRWHRTRVAGLADDERDRARSAKKAQGELF